MYDNARRNISEFFFRLNQCVLIDNNCWQIGKRTGVNSWEKLFLYSKHIIMYRLLFNEIFMVNSYIKIIFKDITLSKILH